MSIFSHFSKNRPQLRMPRSEGVDPYTGIEYEGDVLTGKLSPEEAIRLEAWRVRRNGDPIPSTPRDLDPVLRHHLRMDKP